MTVDKLLEMGWIIVGAACLVLAIIVFWPTYRPRTEPHYESAGSATDGSEGDTVEQDDQC